MAPSRTGAAAARYSRAPLTRTRSVEGNKALVRRLFELVQSGDVAGAVALWANRAFNHGHPADPVGLPRIYESLRAVQESHSLHEKIAEGEWVAVCTTCTRTHAAKPVFPINGGIFEGIDPSGRTYTVRHLHLFGLVDG